jgi:hypothetical protein
VLITGGTFTTNSSSGAYVLFIAANSTLLLNGTVTFDGGGVISKRGTAAGITAYYAAAYATLFSGWTGNAYPLDMVTLSQDAKGGTAYTYDNGTAHTGSVVAALPDGFTATSLSVNGTAASNYTTNLSAGTVTFGGTFDSGADALALSATGTVAAFPNETLTISTAAFGVNVEVGINLSGISPSIINTAGGAVVTLNGSGLDGATGLTVDGGSVAITGKTASQITFTAPAHSSGAVDVVVTFPSGTKTITLNYAPANFISVYTAVGDFNTANSASLTIAEIDNTTIKISGTKSGVTTGLTLNISGGLTVQWDAEVSASISANLISIGGAGTFEVLGGSISNTGSSTENGNAIRTTANATVNAKGCQS